MRTDLTGWLVYKKQDAARNHGFITMLMKEAEILNISLELVFEEDLTYGIVDTRLSIRHPYLSVEKISFVVMRAINPLLSKQFEGMGLPCYNPSAVSEICNNKALTYQFVAKLGIPLLTTYFISYNSFPVDHIPFQFPMVLKQAGGRGGKEVFLVSSTEEITELLTESPNKQFVLQELSDNPGKDLRVFVIGTNVIGAVLRESHTSFKANYTLGGMVSPYQLSDSEMELVQRIASELKGDFFGIDFLLNQNNELLFNEIEDVVGCRSLYATTDVNAAALYMEYIKDQF
ncbi:ATP-grasp domain-containing protein [Neobacillus sp. Marseille-QA0830]